MDDGRIGKYRLDRTIGVGSFATVWLAHDELLDAPVAIKVLADNWARNPDVRRRFVDEAKILRKVDDDHVVRIHVIDELIDGRPYFVMTWADRGTLADRIDDRAARGDQFGIDEAVDIVSELCAGLTVVHDADVVHRDVKPSNVLFRSRPQATTGPSPGEQILLSDFGLAKDMALASGFTLPAGTPAYMAPEQARTTADLDRRADVYAAGAILFELLTGRLPFEGATLADIAHRPEVAVADLVARFRPDAPPGLGRLIERALEFRREARPATAAALADAASAAVSGEPRPGEPVTAERRSTTSIPTTSIPTTPPPVPGVRRRVAEVLQALDEETSLPSFTEAAARLDLPCRVVVVADRGQEAFALLSPLASSGLRVDTLNGHDPGGLATADVVVLELPANPAAAAGAAAEVRALLREVPAGPVVLAGLAATDALPSLRDHPALNGIAIPLGSVEDAASVVGAVREVSRRDDLVRASAALATIDAALRADPSPELETGWSLVGDAVDALRLDVPAVDELGVLREVVAGRVAFPAAFQPELRRVLLASDPPSRLGLPATTSVVDQRNTTAALLNRWRAAVNDGRVPFASRGASEVLVRSLDRLWTSLT